MKNTLKEVQEEIKSLPEWDALCGNDCDFYNIKDYNKGHKYFKNSMGLLFVVVKGRIWCLEKDDVGIYRHRVINKVDIRRCNPITLGQFMNQIPGYERQQLAMAMMFLNDGLDIPVN